jgi:hypothetical protein
MANNHESIQALVPRDDSGFQFVCYADACSGVPGAPHEASFAAVNAVVARLRPQPEFICFPGDEIRGLTGDTETLREQWAHWLRHEMSWLDRQSIPLYHTTANHTTYDSESEAVFRDVLSHLPRNGPPEQCGLAYFARRDNLLMVFVNTLDSTLGGEGRVETEWLEQTLSDHSDARYKLVFGHHPVHPVNGFSGEYQREIASQNGRDFWRVLVRQGVLAYFCSHILAFDVQVHDGVLQVLTAGAGTAYRMPEGIEHLHCVQAAIDSQGLRYQVLDTSGQLRESLSWPLSLPSSASWKQMTTEVNGAALNFDQIDLSTLGRLVVFKMAGIADASGNGAPQTLLAGWRQEDKNALPSVWVGLQGREQRLCVLLSQAPERSPHLWLGPEIKSGKRFELQVGLHGGMGPGGIMWRESDASVWSSFVAASPWGTERVPSPDQWSVGGSRRGPLDQAFRGEDLCVTAHSQSCQASR